ncbi:uncharacterized protein MONOS_5865 [Monocercomonoides exilis]|uniref:uncharacterized protein n=1 Tax=Monocercomonoides exilis TaxID=2049356 RepID=UPI003559E0BD|nr:hypothetical protein MONOS_5865 [Monocercomonoides exilis]|eukprot:MONOS_5865.1-p1 / transcript=MONOS_5865.1 / gene=MONOS_5865 / organism=Monocercomonoides_exilis_PA203 / gene_product=unspecified product / transcript_product=unspecified product / location=Mono_scaffold00176:58417-60544(-) / protein_length=382 / sequence_SO=supercontig / SO=protein_coding / is_pseudo=false
MDMENESNDCLSGTAETKRTEAGMCQMGEDSDEEQLFIDERLRFFHRTAQRCTVRVHRRLFIHEQNVPFTEQGGQERWLKERHRNELVDFSKPDAKLTTDASPWACGATLSVGGKRFLHSGCSFQMCKARYDGGGLRFFNISEPGSGCIYEEDGEGGSSLLCKYAIWSRCDIYYDQFNVFLSTGNPFYECYTTNTNEQRMCYVYNYSSSGSWVCDQTSKKDWLKRGILNRFVAVSGGNAEELCGANESYTYRATGVTVIRSVIQVSLSVTLMEGNHQSETTTIDIGSKKSSVIGKGRMESSIEMKSLSSAAAGALFGVMTGHLGLLRMKVNCYSEAETSPSVVVVSDGGGSLSLEDVVITTSVSSGNVIHFQCLWCRCHGC